MTPRAWIGVDLAAPRADFTGFTNANTAGTTSVLTLADIERARELIRNMPPPTPFPSGVRLIEMPYPRKQARKHRKKRINAKWCKRYGWVIDQRGYRASVHHA